MNDKIVKVYYCVLLVMLGDFIHIYIYIVWFKCVHVLFIFCVNYSHDFEFYMYTLS